MSNEFAPLRAYVTGLGERARDTQALYAEAGRIMTQDIIPAVFRSGGPGWDSLAKPRKDGTTTPLVRTGALRDSITFDASSDRLVIGTSIQSKGFPYGVVHQYGAKHVPRRQFLFWTREAIAKITDRWKQMVFRRQA